jgi:hypothetical protein
MSCLVASVYPTSCVNPAPADFSIHCGPLVSKETSVLLNGITHLWPHRRAFRVANVL